MPVSKGLDIFLLTKGFPVVSGYEHGVLRLCMSQGKPTYGKMVQKNYLTNMANA